MAGAAVKAAQEHRDLTAGELGTAALSGAGSGAVGGAAGPLLGKAVGAVGAKLAGPVARALGREAGAGDGLMSRVVDDGAAFCRLAGHSFTGRTKVLRPNGSKTAIAKLKAGDKVRTYDPKTGKSHARMVAAVWVNHDTDLLDLKIHAGGHTSTLHTTASHPFYSLTRKTWVRADELSTSDRLVSAAGRATTLVGLAATPGTENRYDLTVDVDHDYYVSVGNAGAPVHNCGTIRGGDAASEATHVLHQKLSSAGEHLKYGIAKIPTTTRYTARELNGGSLNILARGSKRDMLSLERSLHETLPIGPEEGQNFYIQKQLAKGLRPPPYS